MPFITIDHDAHPLPDSTYVFRCGHPRTPENVKPGYSGRTAQCRTCHRAARWLAEYPLAARDRAAERNGRGQWEGRYVWRFGDAFGPVTQYKFQSAPTPELQARRAATAARLWARRDAVSDREREALRERQRAAAIAWAEATRAAIEVQFGGSS